MQTAKEHVSQIFIPALLAHFLRSVARDKKLQWTVIFRSLCWFSWCSHQVYLKPHKAPSLADSGFFSLKKGEISHIHPANRFPYNPQYKCQTVYNQSFQNGDSEAWNNILFLSIHLLSSCFCLNNWLVVQFIKSSLMCKEAFHDCMKYPNGLKPSRHGSIESCSAPGNVWSVLSLHLKCIFS